MRTPTTSEGTQTRLTAFTMPRYVTLAADLPYEVKLTWYADPNGEDEQGLLRAEVKADSLTVVFIHESHWASYTLAKPEERRHAEEEIIDFVAADLAKQLKQQARDLNQQAATITASIGVRRSAGVPANPVP